MCIAHCGVRQVEALVRSKGGRKFLWSKLKKFCPAASWWGLLRIKLWHTGWTSTDDWLTVFHQRIAIYDGFGKKTKKAGGTILTNREVKKARCFINEPCGAISCEKLWVRYKVDKEWNIGFDSSDTKLLKTPFNMTGCFDVREPSCSYFDQE